VNKNSETNLLDTENKTEQDVIEDTLEELNQLNFGPIEHLDSLDIDYDDIIEINELEDNLIEVITRNQMKYIVSSTEDAVISCEKIEKKEVQHFTKEEKEIVAAENIALIHFVLKSIHTQNIPYEELVDAGMMGYAKALESFDKGRNVKFSTYAINCIRNEIFFFLRKEQKHLANTISMNTILSTDNNGNTLELIDTIDAEDEEKSLEHVIENSENRRILLDALEYLKPEEQYILIYRFGLDKGIIKTQKEIAETINMSQANVSKIQKNCLHKLRLILRKEFRNRS